MEWYARQLRMEHDEPDNKDDPTGLLSGYTLLKIPGLFKEWQHSAELNALPKTSFFLSMSSPSFHITPRSQFLAALLLDTTSKDYNNTSSAPSL